MCCVMVSSGGADSTRHHWSRCVPSQSAQDLLYPPWRWRARNGPHWCQVPSGPLPPHPPCHPHWSLPQLQVRQAELWDLGVSSLWLSPHPAHLLCVYLHDGFTWIDGGARHFPAKIRLLYASLMPSDTSSARLEDCNAASQSWCGHLDCKAGVTGSGAANIQLVELHPALHM